MDTTVCQTSDLFGRLKIFINTTTKLQFSQGQLGKIHKQISLVENSGLVINAHVQYETALYIHTVQAVCITASTIRTYSMIYVDTDQG